MYLILYLTKLIRDVNIILDCSMCIFFKFPIEADKRVGFSCDFFNVNILSVFNKKFSSKSPGPVIDYRDGFSLVENGSTGQY